MTPFMAQIIIQDMLSAGLREKWATCNIAALMNRRAQIKLRTVSRLDSIIKEIVEA